MLAIGYHTHKGSVRSVNEDRIGAWMIDIEDHVCNNLNNGDTCSLDPNQFVVAAVADGMGGSDLGEFASNKVMEMLDRSLHSFNGSFNELLIEIRVFFSRAQEGLLNENDSKNGKLTYGTTLSIVIIGKKQIHIYWIGDSRVYTLSNSFNLEIEEHTLVWQKYRSGEITFDEVFFDPESHILTRCLGYKNQSSEPEYKVINLEKKMKILLCSDGINSMIPHHIIKRILNRDYSPKDLTQALTDISIQEGGTDNISSIVIDTVERSTKYVPEKLKSEISPGIKKFKKEPKKVKSKSKINRISFYVVLILVAFLFFFVYYNKDSQEGNCIAPNLNLIQSNMDNYETFLSNRSKIINLYTEVEICLSNFYSDDNRSDRIIADIKILKNKINNTKMTSESYLTLRNETQNVNSSITFIYE